MNEAEKYFRMVSDLVGREEFNSRVKEKMDRSRGLLEEATAARIVAAELGRKEMKIKEIASLLNGESALIEGEIEDIAPVREFTTRNGSKGRVINVVISDYTGSCRLTLWNRDTALAKKMRHGMKVRVVNGKVKVSQYGTEVSLGKFSSLWLEADGEFFQVK